MYFWDVDELAEDLKQDKVTEREKAKYLFAFVFLALFWQFS